MGCIGWPKGEPKLERLTEDEVVFKLKIMVLDYGFECFQKLNSQSEDI